MTKPHDPEALLSAYLADGMEVLPDRVVDSVLDEIHRTRQRAVFGPSTTRSMFKTALGAAAVVAVLVSGALLITRPSQPAIGGPSPKPTMHPSQSQHAVVVPSATPSPTPKPLVWTQASLKEDWPAPVRPEPGGRAVVRPLVPVEGKTPEYTDPLDDTGSSLPWVDIRGLFVGLGAGHAWVVSFDLANPPPLVAPTEQWIAYGVVVDTDRDGVPDLRFGVDNIPATAPGKDEHRAWITDLHTGRTVSAVGAPYGVVGETYLDTFYPPGFHFGGDTTGPPEVDALSGLRAPFYAWASMIEDGRVVATDYAPDVGWLDPSAEAKR